MSKKLYSLVRADKYDIEEPEFFDTYCEAFAEMKRQYDYFSKGCTGELNDDNAWCIGDDFMTIWKIFDMQING